MQNQLRRKFGFERLEDRRVLNGTVIATQTGGLLTLTGDSAANVLSVNQTGVTTLGAKIQVVGVATKINNQVPVVPTNGYKYTFTDVTDILIDLGAGNDALAFLNTTLTGGVAVVMGAGKDVVKMTNVTASGLDPIFHAFSIVVNTSAFDSTPVHNIDNTGDEADLAILTNLRSANMFGLVTGAGNDVATLTKVASNAQLLVSMGPGRDSASLIKCSSPDAQIGTVYPDAPASTNGTLIGLGNTFVHQTINTDAFTTRLGDLKTSH